MFWIYRVAANTKFTKWQLIRVQHLKYEKSLYFQQKNLTFHYKIEAVVSSITSNFHSIYLQGSFWGRVHNLFIRIPNRIRELFPDCDWNSGVRFLYWLSGGNGVSHVDTWTWVKLNKPNIIKNFTDILSRFLAFHIPN